MFDTTENKTKPPFFRDTTKYREMRGPSESSQEEKPRNTTSLSTSSLVRPEANFPLQSLASIATTAEATSSPLRPSFAGTIRTRPTASSELHAAPVDATAIGVSARLKTLGLRSAVLRMKFDASSMASICMSDERFCGVSGLLLPRGAPGGAATAIAFGAGVTEKSPALATPCCFTTATQLASVGSSTAV